MHDERIMAHPLTCHRLKVRPGISRFLRGGVIFAIAWLGACTQPHGPLVVTDPDPGIKIPAMQKAVREKDLSVVPQLIKDLESDDPAVRMYANHALESLTGQRFGYRYFADEDGRAVAIKQWKDWLAKQNSDAGTANEVVPPSVENARSSP